jgi:hypothetical protein
MKEVRNANLVATIKSTLPYVGHVKIATKDGRKASFIFRNMPFIVSSRLVVKEQGIGKLRTAGVETPESVMLSNRLRSVTA